MTDSGTDATNRRVCGECGFCCKIPEIAELGKPAGQWCAHWSAANGCGIYDDRPETCRRFVCLYLSDPTIAEDWHPAQSHMMLVYDSNGPRLLVHVDPHRPEAWRRQPYHTMLRDYAKNLMSRRGQVVAKIANRWIAILPERDVDLGTLDGKFTIVYTPKISPDGVRMDVSVQRQ